MQTEATPAAQTLEAMLLAMRAGLEEPGIVPLRREPTDDVSSLRQIALVALGGGDSGGAGGETDGRLRHACAGVLAYRLRIAAETNGTRACRRSPRTPSSRSSSVSGLRASCRPRSRRRSPRSGSGRGGGVALKAAPLLPPGQWHRPRPPQKPRTIDFSQVDLTFLGGYPARNGLVSELVNILSTS